MPSKCFAPAASHLSYRKPSPFSGFSATTPVSFEVFLHEYRITFPVGVDSHDPEISLPITMSRYQLRGTPSLVVIDRAGRIRLNAFGQIDDLYVGGILARLIDEPRPESGADCDPDIGSCPKPGIRRLAYALAGAGETFLCAVHHSVQGVGYRSISE